MDDDEDLFERAMRDMAVKPLGERDGRCAVENRHEEDHRDARKDDAENDDEDSLFLDTMELLFAPPDKDRRAATRPTREVRRLPAARRLHETPQDEVDLHGMRVEEALRRLTGFLVSARSARLRTVLVITGKGLHSDDGRGVLKEAVERWLRDQGQGRVRAFQEAPRTLGGSGAYLVHLS